MGSKDFNYQKLARYLAGECSPKERHQVEEWIAEDPVNEKKYRECKRIWNLSEEASVPGVGIDSDSDWRQLRSRVELTDASGTDPSDQRRDKRFRRSSLHTATQKVIRVAAIFLVAGFIGLFAYQNYYQEPQDDQNDPVLREISAERGQQANLRLEDGTEVTLNAESELRLPTEFASDIREVYLDGEAYFNVNEDNEKPFLVHSERSVVKVLGTSFTVRSYPEDDNVRVVVEEGRVSFANTTIEDQVEVLLEQDEMAELYFRDNEIAKQQVEDMELFLSWRDGYLKFRNTPLTEVAQSLERRYDVEITFEHSEIENMVLTAYLKSRSIQNVLEVIAASLEIDYRLNDNEVIFLKE